MNQAWEGLLAKCQELLGNTSHLKTLTRLELWQTSSETGPRRKLATTTGTKPATGIPRAFAYLGPSKDISQSYQNFREKPKHSSKRSLHEQTYRIQVSAQKQVRMISRSFAQRSMTSSRASTNVLRSKYEATTSSWNKHQHRHKQKTAISST